jgi:hypothetical protein
MSYETNVGDNGSFYDGCIRTYGAATRLMGDVWEEVVGKPMETLSGSPKTRFREALRHYEEAIRCGGTPSLGGKLRKAAAADEVLRSLIDESLDKPDAPLPQDVDDVPPTIFKDAIRDEAGERAADEPIDVDLDQFLKGTVARVVRAMAWSRRLNVGENRHFPRMIQWVREIQVETTWEDGVGLRLMNKSGAGRVAAHPQGPQGLKVRIDADWL